VIQVLASSSAANCTVVGGELLLDAGLPMPKMRKALKGKTAGLRWCLLTHEHQDHARGVDSLLKAGIEVRATRKTIEALGVEHHRLAPVSQHFQLGDWLVRPFRVNHDAADPVGFALSHGIADAEVLYLTDTGPFQPREWMLARKWTHILIEANHLGEHIDQWVETGDPRAARTAMNHLSVEAAIDFLAKIEPDGAEIHLLHLSDRFGEVEFGARVKDRFPHARIFIAPA